MSTATTIKLTNNRGDDDHLYLLLTAGTDSQNVSKIALNQNVKWTDFSQGNPELTFSFDTIDSARLYVGYGAFPISDGATIPEPVPYSLQYYGWIEFHKGDDNTVWINLSNVDMAGLMLEVGLTDVNSGESKIIQYETSQADLIKQLINGALVSETAPAIKECNSGQRKIVAPNIDADSYQPFDTYLGALTNSNAILKITSDISEGGTAKVFTGNFISSSTGQNDNIIYLQSQDNDTFAIKRDQLNSSIIYRCDGGTLVYNGQAFPQNRTPKNDPNSSTADQIITNSTFRNIMIGFNEGYFTATGPNDSSDFHGLTPFANGEGNQYAKIIHDNSDSYGFPYADANLKVSFQADASKLITVTILPDN